MKDKPELPKRWSPTHRVTHRDGSWTKVMLVASGAAYTRAEWAVRAHSRHSTALRFMGTWKYRGEEFKGKVGAV